MIKLTNAYLVGIIAATLLVGCGGGDSEGNEGTESTGTEQVENTTDTETSQPVEPDNGTGGETTATPPTTDTTTTPNTTTTTTTSASKTFGADVMPVLNAKCKVCHGSNGRFTITTTSSTYNNIVALKGSATAGGQYLLSKGSGTEGHGGGTVIATSSAEYATIKSWVDAGAANN